MEIESIRIDQIDTAGRLRKADPKQVQAIAESIHDVGLLNPVTIAAVGDGYVLVAGLHRLEACRSLGMEEVPAIMCGLDELRRGLAECDENLCRMLTPAERAMFTARRKELYEALHPETVREATLKQGDASPSRKFCETGKADRFTADTAAKTGASERKVQLDAERGEKVCAEAIDKLTGTHLDKGVYLDVLKKLTPEEQVAKVEADLAAPVPVKRAPTPEPAPNESAGDPDAPGVTPEDVQPAPAHVPEDDGSAKLRREFRKLTPEAQEDEFVGLHLDLDEARQEIERLKAENEHLKARWMASVEGSNMGRALGLAERRASTAEGRASEHLATAKRLEYRVKVLEKEKAELQRQLENQIIPMS